MSKNWVAMVKYETDKKKTTSELKIDDAWDMKKSFVRCMRGEVSIKVGNQTRKMKNNPRRKKTKKNPLMNSPSTERKRREDL